LPKRKWGARKKGRIDVVRGEDTLFYPQKGRERNAALRIRESRTVNQEGKMGTGRKVPIYLKEASLMVTKGRRGESVFTSN